MRRRRTRGARATIARPSFILADIIFFHNQHNQQNWCIFNKFVAPQQIRPWVSPERHARSVRRATTRGGSSDGSWTRCPCWDDEDGDGLDGDRRDGGGDGRGGDGRVGDRRIGDRRVGDRRDGDGDGDGDDGDGDGRNGDGATGTGTTAIGMGTATTGTGTATTGMGTAATWTVTATMGTALTGMGAAATGSNEAGRDWGRDGRDGDGRGGDGRDGDEDGLDEDGFDGDGGGRRGGQPLREKTVVGTTSATTRASAATGGRYRCRGQLPWGDGVMGADAAGGGRCGGDRGRRGCRGGQSPLGMGVWVTWAWGGHGRWDEGARVDEDGVLRYRRRWREAGWQQQQRRRRRRQ